MSIYGLGAILSKIAQFVLLPIYTRMLQPADYGLLEMIYLNGNIFAIFFVLMIGSGFIRLYYDDESVLYRKRLFSTTFYFSLLSGIVFLSLIFIFSKSYTNLMFKGELNQKYILYIAVAMFLSSVNMILYNRLMVRKESVKYISLNLFTTIMTLCLAIYFLVYLKMGIRGILISQIISFASEYIILFILQVNSLTMSFDFFLLKNMLKYSIPLIPVQLASFVLTLSDRYFINIYQNIEDVGFYSLAYKISAIVSLLTMKPLKAFGPHILSLLKDEERCKKELSSFSSFFLFTVLSLSLLLSLFASEIILIVSGKAFLKGASIVVLLTLSYSVIAFNNVILYGIHIVKKNYLNMIFWIVAAIINIGLNILLIPRFGIAGASSATLISYLIITLFYFLALYRVFRIRFQYGIFVFLSILFSIFYFIGNNLEFSLIINIVLKITIVCAYLIIGMLSLYTNSVEKIHTPEV